MSRRRALALWGFASGIAAFGLAALCAPLPSVLRGGDAVVLEDASGARLREPAGGDGLRSEWVRLRDVPLAARQAIVQAEDHHLGFHPGVDPAGIARAAWLDARAGKVVAGGSTLAMQLARLAYGLPRSVFGKLEQALLAPLLSARLGSSGILEAYVNLAPFGRDVRGIALASRTYFGKPLRDLTTGEAVALACLPRAPTAYDPYRHPERLLRRRAHVLSLMAERSVITPGVAESAAAEPLALAPFARPFRAPHASALALHEAWSRGAPHATHVRTTLDGELQRTTQWACKSAVAALDEQGGTDCAAVAMRVSTGEVLALVGSPDFRSPYAGQVNAALSPRQPGSALKPFVYALAFERGRSPGSSIEDVPTTFVAQFGPWRPENYDRRFHGTITLREALANSYNIPAVKLVRELGVSALLERLSAAGLANLSPAAAERYGLGVALGDADVTLYELVTAYATLARGGAYLEPTLLREVQAAGARVELPARERRRVFSKEVSYLVGHVLQDRAARRASFGEASALEFPFDVAVKTGTSSSYRDNWTIGWAGDLVVGVWVGRHDGAPMHGVSGVSGAAPAFRRIMMYALGKRAGAWPAPPAGVARRMIGSRYDLVLAASSSLHEGVANRAAATSHESDALGNPERRSGRSY